MTREDIINEDSMTCSKVFTDEERVTCDEKSTYDNSLIHEDNMISEVILVFVTADRFLRTDCFVGLDKLTCKEKLIREDRMIIVKTYKLACEQGQINLRRLNDFYVRPERSICEDNSTCEPGQINF